MLNTAKHEALQAFRSFGGGDVAVAESTWRRSAEVASLLQDPWLEATARVGLGLVHDVMPELRTLANLAQRQGALEATALAHLRLWELSAETEVTLADRDLFAAEAAALACRDPYVLAEVGLAGAEWSIRQHRSTASMDVADAARRAEEVGDPRLLAVSEGLQAWVASLTGKLDSVDGLLEQAAARGAPSRALKRIADAVAAINSGPSARRMRNVAHSLSERTVDVDHKAQSARLLALASAVAQKRDVSQILDSVAEAVLELLDVERGFVVLVDGDELHIETGKQRSGAMMNEPSMSVVRQCIQTRTEVIHSDLVAQRGDRSRSMMDQGLISVLCVPMIDETDVVGAIYADGRYVTASELDEAAWILRGLAAHAAIAVSNARVLEAERARSLRARETAHDVRNWLASIQSATSLLRIIDDPAERDLLFGVLSEASDMLNRQLSAILDEGTTGDRTRVSVTELVETLVRLLTPEARRTDIEFRVELKGGCEVLAHRDELARALMNLLGNALKYAPEGSDIDVSCACLGDVFEFSVRDYGPGIPSGQLAHIFESGEQGLGAKLGLGLGLGITRRVVEEHRGTVVAENLELGARFVVRLPVARS